MSLAREGACLTLSVKVCGSMQLMDVARTVSRPIGVSEDRHILERHDRLSVVEVINGRPH